MTLCGLALALAACGEPGQAQTEVRLREMAEELIPRIERAVGLSFKAPPRLAVRSREQVDAYIAAKIETELPPEEIERQTLAYRLFGLIPDTLDLGVLLLELYAEQVVGYFDPDSAMLYVVDGADPVIMRFTVAHELVHALQDQYMSLATLLGEKRQNDRRLAAQAVLEGQATLVSMVEMLPGGSLDALEDFWGQARSAIRQQQRQMPVFSTAPLVIQEGMIFPYLAGADFMRWFGRQYPDTVPYGSLLPASTEHILHFDRYRSGDAPLDLVYPDAEQAVYDDGLGEFEIRILLTELTGSESVGSAGAFGWAGDRYAVFETGGGHALVWWSIWDTERYAERFWSILAREWEQRARDGRRYTVERVELDGRAGVLLIDAPIGWSRWRNPPRVSVR